jgi:glycogen(starch) synthase
MPPPIRVLALGNAYPPHHLGGYEIIWRGVTRRLRSEGHATRILTTDLLRPGVAEDEADVHRELDWYWREHRWRRLGPREVLALERHNARVFDRHLEEFRPDVIAWWPVGGMSLGLIERGRRAGLPAVLFVLDPWLSYGPRHDLWLRTWRALPPLAGLADRVTGLPTRVDFCASGRWVFCSETLRAGTLALPAGRSIRDSSVITPGVDRLYLDAPAEPQPPAWSWRLLYVGRVVEQKGVATAIESLPLLPPAATLRIVGEGDEPYRQELQALAARLGVADRVQFEPARAQEALPEVYRAADAVLFPVQWAEPWGLVPLEAMALGRPVVATGRGGSGDYLREGENALLFEAGDPAGLSAALVRLSEDPVLRAHLRAGGLRTAREHDEDHFNAQAVAELTAAALPTAPPPGRGRSSPPRRSPS